MVKTIDILPCLNWQCYHCEGLNTTENWEGSALGRVLSKSPGLGLRSGREAQSVTER